MNLFPLSAEDRLQPAVEKQQEAKLIEIKIPDVIPENRFVPCIICECVRMCFFVCVHSLV